MSELTYPPICFWYRNVVTPSVFLCPDIPGSFSLKAVWWNPRDRLRLNWSRHAKVSETVIEVILRFSIDHLGSTPLPSLLDEGEEDQEDE